VQTEHRAAAPHVDNGSPWPWPIDRTAAAASSAVAAATGPCGGRPRGRAARARAEENKSTPSPLQQQRQQPSLPQHTTAAVHTQRQPAHTTSRQLMHDSRTARNQ